MRTLTPATFAVLLTALKKEPSPTNQNPADDTPLCLRSKATVVTTTRHKGNASVLGVQAGEFDHFVIT
ncbi:hypothetical protein ACIBJF_28485 [Streptomyces sp. NPDC050743]|uniref:hypothetical protein n=1 Tax=Streptomyces sp. NPDC050743 TaxID=3365634 RepID=UPI0037A7A904